MSSNATYSKLTPRINPYFLHMPTPKQAAFLLLPHKEVLYGGAAGGGKSDALLMAALQYVDVPGYSALIIRRTFADLMQENAALDRAKKWLVGRTDVKFSASEKKFRFPSGATLTFGYCDVEDDKYQYMSANWNFIAFDELTQFTETQYRYLFSRLRSDTDSRIPNRMRAASNPGGRGHDWVKSRFIDEPTSIDTDGKPTRRIFVRAGLIDNPFIKQADYRESLMNLDPITRKQLMDGDWTARRAGMLFKREWFEKQIVTLDQLPRNLKRTRRFWDLAATEATKENKDPDWTAGARLALSDDPTRIYILDVRRVRKTPLQVEQFIKGTAVMDKKAVPIDIEQEPGAAGKAVVDHYIREVLGGFTVHGVRSSGSKESFADALASQCEAGNVYLLKAPSNEVFLNEAEQVFQEGVHDDQVDAASKCYDRLMTIGGFYEIMRRLNDAQNAKRQINDAIVDTAEKIVNAQTKDAAVEVTAQVGPDPTASPLISRSRWSPWMGTPEPRA